MKISKNQIIQSVGNAVGILSKGEQCRSDKDPRQKLLIKLVSQLRKTYSVFYYQGHQSKIQMR